MFCIPESKASCFEGDVSTSLTLCNSPSAKHPALACTCALGVACADLAQKKKICLKTSCNVLPEETGNAYVNTRVCEERAEDGTHSSVSTRQFSGRQRCCRWMDGRTLQSPRAAPPLPHRSCHGCGSQNFHKRSLKIK